MSTPEWTILEKLLLSQAVYKYGEDNWFQIARNLKHHALLDRPSDYFNQKNCSLQYYLMVDKLDKEKQNPLTQDMPPVVQIARELYTLRLEELKKAINQDEEKFLQLVTEIDEIRAGKWDDRLLGLPAETSAQETTEQALPKEPAAESTGQPASDETVVEEELTKVEMDNLEDELRIAELPKSSSEESFQSAQDTNHTIQKPPESQVVEIQAGAETQAIDINNPPTNIHEEDQKAQEQIVQDRVAEEKPVEEQPVEEESAETQPAVQVAEETQPVEELTAVAESMEVTPNYKRQIDDSDTLEEPMLKRQRTEKPLHRIESNPDLQVIRRDDINQEPEPEVNEDLLTIDTTRTEYSTDVSQVTTPADTSDVNLREGTESVAGSECNAATPTAERKRSILSRDDQRHKSWQKNINLLWREIANHKNGAMFMNPIKESIAPHYYEIVKRPMDLKTIKNRIRDGMISTTTEFERDVVLMLNNSLMYNKEGTEVYQLAREMLDDAMEQIKIFRTADTDTSASSHTRAASKKN